MNDPVCFTQAGILVITGLLGGLSAALGLLYRRVLADADEWKEIAKENLSLAREGVEVTKAVGRRAARR